MPSGCDDHFVSASDRLTGLDASFLHLEDAGAHMHVASVLVFDGTPPTHDELMGSVDERLHLVPRYRQRVASVPLGQARPQWTDDPHFSLRYHVRHAALPAPGGTQELRHLAARLFGQRLDRGRPLWEIWLVEALGPDTGGSFALIAKTHHALVDGISGVDILSVLFDSSPDPPPVAPPRQAWQPRPSPSSAQLLGNAMLERALLPGEVLRGLRRLTRAPRQAAERALEQVRGVGALAVAGLTPAPPSSLNVDIGPHRRFAWVDADLARFKAIKNALGGTLNDAVLAAVSLALGSWLRGRGEDTTGLVLKAMVPTSVRADAQRGALGNRVAAMYAPLPVGEDDPGAVLATVSAALKSLKESGQAVGAQTLTQLADFAPPTILTQAGRLQTRQRLFNLVVTNVPGPQSPLYLMGRRLVASYPVVPLGQRQALAVAIMSYDGRLAFGLLADFDAVPDLDELVSALERAITDLAAAAGPTKPAGSARAAGSARVRDRPGVIPAAVR
jgi:diacylglycerol O-acyltransferase